jgi:hypothetical protein
MVIGATKSPSWLKDTVSVGVALYAMVAAFTSTNKASMPYGVGTGDSTGSMPGNKGCGRPGLFLGATHPVQHTLLRRCLKFQSCFLYEEVANVRYRFIRRFNIWDYHRIMYLCVGGVAT